MLDKANLNYIDKLHHVGRELTVLKRMYESYGKIITHVLDSQQLRMSSFHGVADLSLTDESTGTVTESQKLKMDVSGESSEPLEHSFMTRGTDRRQHFGPVLTAEAITRFERLRDRIQIYALSEIQDCLNEKESMAFMVRCLVY